jgi:hypothetical protein
MPAPVIPTKTALGQEELRRRTGGLGQRHRTILFLIDGRRPLSEVLSLAQQAGAATSHFEDLVRLGYVEMPPEDFVATVPLESMAEEPPAEAAELTHVELTVPADEDAPVLPVPETVSETVVLAPLPAAAEPEPEPAPTVPTPVPTPAVAAPPAIVLPPPAPVPVRSPVAQAVEELVDENEPLGRIRRCLLDALHMDPTPFGFRAAMRVRTARNIAALIQIVWEMERDMSHSMRSRAGLQNLQRARELLGLGNTLVDEDSQSPGTDESRW